MYRLFALLNVLMSATYRFHSGASNSVALLIAISVVTAAPRPSEAQSIPIVQVNPATECPGANCLDEPNDDKTWGWTFYVYSPIIVTHVGWYDRNGDGLNVPHRIGLWKDASGATTSPYISGAGVQLLGTGIDIPAGTTAELDGVWRKVAVANGTITLEPGGYAIAGLGNPSSTDQIRYMLDRLVGESKLPHDARMTIGAPGYSAASGFNRPDTFYLVNGVEFGPTLFVVPVPESSTAILIAVSLSSILVVRPRRCGKTSTRERDYV